MTRSRIRLLSAFGFLAAAMAGTWGGTASQAAVPKADLKATAPARNGTAGPIASRNAAGKAGVPSRAKAKAKAKAKANANAKSKSRANGKSKATGMGKRHGKTKAVVHAPAPLPPPRGRVVVFPFRGDDTGSAAVQAHVVRVLRGQGLKVVTTIRAVDSAEQYRDMAVTLDLVGYVDGEVNDDGDQASLTVHVRSGVSGLRVASATFAGERRTLPAEVRKSLWTEVGPAFSRVCADAAKPRKHERAPMRIEAGTPIESTPRDREGT